MKTKYRIITDEYAGYEVQKKTWFWPFWFQMDYCNTFSTIERAKAGIEADKQGRRVVFETEWI